MDLRVVNDNNIYGLAALGSVQAMPLALIDRPSKHVGTVWINSYDNFGGGAFWRLQA
jgi:hypothetical protein